MEKIPNLGVIIITLNEETNIEECLRSAGPVEEIVVVDAGSTDRTREICSKYGCRVVEHPFQGYGEQKNFALSFAKTEWVLSLDADECLSAGLREEIGTLLAAPGREQGYLIPRRNYRGSTWMNVPGLYPDYQLRLFRRREGVFSKGVHERVLLNGKIGKCTHPILHYTYRNLDDYLEKVLDYSGKEAEQLWRMGRRFAWWHVWQVPAETLRQLVLRRHLFYGYEGWLYAAMMTLYRLLKLARLRELTREKTCRACGGAADREGGVR